jgi:arsenate reductase
MAAALFNALVDPSKGRAQSAGTEPAERVHAAVVAAMQEQGIDLSTAQPVRLTLEMASSSNLLVTMGCGEACPVVPGVRREDWPVDDPAARPLDEVRRIREAIRLRVEELIAREGLGRRAERAVPESLPGGLPPFR